MTTFPDIYKALASIDCSSFTEKKKDLTYLSWSHAWNSVASRYDASYEVVRFDWKPYFFDESLGYYVETQVTIEWHTRKMQLFVMDWANNAMMNQSYKYSTRNWDKTVEKATMFEINTAIMRCLTKNLAIFWLGINIYAGEDLPLIDEDWNPVQKKIEPKAPAPKTEYARKTDEHGLTLDDYIDNINMEADIETVKVYFERWLKLCTTEKQASFFTSVKDKRKKQLGF
jgi:hypothetical protein